jgi:long-chain fatty acid transport protein
MKKNLVRIIVALMLAPGFVFAGGLVTNTNQSASFTRNPAQDAVIGPEGAYYNPAGLVQLQDGFHLSLSNQTISQTREISSTFPRMNQYDFEGKVSAPFFPSVYAVFKQGRMAYSLGVNPIGGGGSANFESGLPSFEQQVAILPTALTLQNLPTTQYSLNSAFDGSSLNWGLQLNASYAINEIVSVSLGLRFITATNNYKGHLTDIMINPNQPAFGASYDGTNMVSAPQFFTDGANFLNTTANTLNALAGGANSFVASLTPYADDYGSFPVSSLITDATQLAQLQTIITAAGQNPEGMNVNTAIAVLTSAAPTFTSNAETFANNANNLAGFANATADKQLDAKQTGTGIAPVIGLNLSFSENFNIALKYEHKASITMTNNTVIDNVGLYPDEATNPNDMPSMFALGVAFKPVSRLSISAGAHYYLDKSADYGKKINNEFVANDVVIDSNFWEAAAGLEYMLTNSLSLSAGYLRTQTGVNEQYHSDLSHSLSTNTIGFGGKYMINRDIGVNLGIMNTFYESHTKDFSTYTETYNRSALSVGLGIDFRF